MSVLWFFMVLGSDFYLLHSDKTLNIQQKITFVLRLMHVCGPKRKESTKSINHWLLGYSEWLWSRFAWFLHYCVMWSVSHVPPHVSECWRGVRYLMKSLYDPRGLRLGIGWFHCISCASDQLSHVALGLWRMISKCEINVLLTWCSWLVW